MAQLAHFIRSLIGGRRRRGFIGSPTPTPQHVLSEIEAILALRDQGALIRRVREFENEFADALGARHAVGANSGTTALALALKALRRRAWRRGGDRRKFMGHDGDRDRRNRRKAPNS